MDNFEIADEFTKRKEGGWVNNRNDPGGATNYGITIGILRKWYKQKGERKKVTAETVRKLSTKEAKTIRKAWYWDKVRGYELPLPVAICVYDFCINSGEFRAIVRLQKVIKKLGPSIAVDGYIGPQTLGAVSALMREGRQRQLITRYGSERFMFYAGLPTFPHFRSGWSHRNSDVIWEAALWALKRET